MKTAKNETSITNTNMIGEQTEFKIKTTATAFKILSDGLYSNKIGSMIRELLCNAHDAHKAAGTLDTPIDVNLPTALDPTFRIRDYGTGLSEEDMKRIYTTYFESTKSDDNSYIGGFGLGSKTPLCYNNEQFFVRSYFNGKMYLYNVSIGENGAPILTKWDDGDTTEHNGLEISIGVDKDDFTAFRTELFAFNLMTGFNLKVNGETALSFKYDQVFENTPAYIPYIDPNDVERNGVSLIVPGSPCDRELTKLDMAINSNYNIFVRVGGVAYKVPTTFFDDNQQAILGECLEDIFNEAERILGYTLDEKTRLTLVQRVYGRKSSVYSIYEQISVFVYDFAVGEIDVTASREEISYTPKTTTMLITKIIGFCTAVLLRGCQLYLNLYEDNYQELIRANLPLIGSLAGSFDNPVLTRVDDFYGNGSQAILKELRVGPFKESLFSIANNCALLKYHRLQYQNVVRKMITTIKSAVIGAKVANEKTDWSVFFTQLGRSANDRIREASDNNMVEEYKKIVLGRTLNVVVSNMSVDSALKNFNDKIPLIGDKTYFVWVKTRTAKAADKIIKELNDYNSEENRLLTYNVLQMRPSRKETPATQRKPKMTRFITLLVEKEKSECRVSEINREKALAEAKQNGTHIVYVPLNITWSELRTVPPSVEIFANAMGSMVYTLNKTKILFMFFQSEKEDAFRKEYAELFDPKCFHNIMNMDDTFLKPFWKIVRQVRNYWFFGGLNNSFLRNIPIGQAKETWRAIVKDHFGGSEDCSSFLKDFYLKNSKHAYICGEMVCNMLDQNGVSLQVAVVANKFIQRVICSESGKTKTGVIDDITEACIKLVDTMPMRKVQAELRSFVDFKPKIYYSYNDEFVEVQNKLTQVLLDNLEKRA